jgi:hypothetical protein
MNTGDHAIYLENVRAALHRTHRPRWSWRYLRRVCGCGAPLVCVTYVLALDAAHVTEQGA